MSLILEARCSLDPVQKRGKLPMIGLVYNERPEARQLAQFVLPASD
jgi:hypothetical protein